MFRRAGRRWGRAMGWILVLTFIVTLAMAVYIHMYEPERYIAEYTLNAVRENRNPENPAPLSMWMLIRDYDHLLDSEGFRMQIVAQQLSDGKTFISARGSATDHMVVIRAVGVDPEIVLGLADAVGDRLVAESVSLLGVESVHTVNRAHLAPQPTEMDKLVRIAKTMLLTFGVLSLLAMLFGSRREHVGWMTPPQQLALPVVGQVAQCSEECEHCARRLSRKKASEAEGRMLHYVNRLVREGVEEIALAVRAAAGMQSCSVAVTGVRGEDNAPAYAVLLGQTLAADGYSVLMIEMDGDAPSLRKYLGASGQTDVVDCLDDDSRLPMALRPTRINTLHMIDCCHDGETMRTVSASLAFRTFVEDAQAIYDYVILSAPPAAFGGGSEAVCSAADQTLLAAKDQRYTANELTGVAAGLIQRGARLTGVVFTGVKMRQLKGIYKVDGKAYRKGKPKGHAAQA